MPPRRRKSYSPPARVSMGVGTTPAAARQGTGGRDWGLRPRGSAPKRADRRRPRHASVGVHGPPSNLHRDERHTHAGALFLEGVGRQRFPLATACLDDRAKAGDRAGLYALGARTTWYGGSTQQPIVRQAKRAGLGVAWRMTARRQSRRDQARGRAPAMGISVFASAKKSQKVLRFAQVRQLRRQRPNIRADMHKPGNAATGATSPSISLVGSPIDQRSGSTWGPVRPATMFWMPRREICSATSARTLSSTTLCLSGATPRCSS